VKRVTLRPAAIENRGMVGERDFLSFAPPSEICLGLEGPIRRFLTRNSFFTVLCRFGHMSKKFEARTLNALITRKKRFASFGVMSHGCNWHQIINLVLLNGTVGAAVGTCSRAARATERTAIVPLS
jgi:hypothetical protein